MILALIRYISCAIIDLIADIAAYILAPIAALFVNSKGEIHPAWKWITTHDAPIDIGHIDGYWSTPRGKMGLWWSRTKWIWRNPAYQVSHWLGYDQRGVVMPADRFKDPRWDSGYPNKSFWRAVNRKGQIGFLYQRQWYYTKHWCIEMQFGWKLYRRDPDQHCMLAFRFSPFKRY